MSAQFVSVKNAFALPVNSEIVLRGWVRSRRDSKGVTFIELNDGSRFKSMQLVVEAGTIPEETLRQVTTGSSIAANGTLGFTQYQPGGPGGALAPFAVTLLEGTGGLVTAVHAFLDPVAVARFESTGRAGPAVAAAAGPTGPTGPGR